MFEIDSWRLVMTRRILKCCRFLLAAAIAVGSFSSPAQAQSTDESKFVLDLGVGLDKSINGNVNSGAIGLSRARQLPSCRSRTATCMGPG